jgi:hypothetical protein
LLLDVERDDRKPPTNTGDSPHFWLSPISVAENAVQVVQEVRVPCRVHRYTQVVERRADSILQVVDASLATATVPRPRRDGRTCRSPTRLRWHSRFPFVAQFGREFQYEIAHVFREIFSLIQIRVSNC